MAPLIAAEMMRGWCGSGLLSDWSVRFYCGSSTVPFTPMENVAIPLATCAYLALALATCLLDGYCSGRAVQSAGHKVSDSGSIPTKKTEVSQDRGPEPAPRAVPEQS